MRPIFLFFLSLTLFLGACSQGQYSEEERQTYIEAEKAHFEAIRIFGNSYDQLNVITSLQDSIKNRITTTDNYIGMEGVNTDSLEQVKSDLSAATEQLNSARNALLTWANEIYGLPDEVSPYDDQNNSEPPSIAKDAGNDMITNNIRYKELPENVTPEELLALQKEQLSSIESIQRQIEASIQKAQTAIAENL